MISIFQVWTAIWAWVEEWRSSGTADILRGSSFSVKLQRKLTCFDPTPQVWEAPNVSQYYILYSSAVLVCGFKSLYNICVYILITIYIYILIMYVYIYILYLHFLGWTLCSSGGVEAMNILSPSRDDGKPSDQIFCIAWNILELYYSMYPLVI